MSDELISAADRLGERVERLDLTVKHLSERTERTEKVTGWTGLAILIVIGVLAALGWAIWQNHLVSDRVEQTSQRVETLTQRSLCPVYGLVVGGYDPTTRALNPDGSYPGSAREKYDQGFDVMRSAWAALGCSSRDVIPKRVDSQS